MKAEFKPRARLLVLLGDQLIGTPHLAIFELVKNGYDADADKVEVVISNPDDLEGGSIKITDFNGTGMDQNTIINVWLEPGAEHRKVQRETGVRTKKYNRLPLGEKGVGRFAVHKLGRKINLVTKSVGCKELHLEIDWDDLEKCKYISDLSINIEEKEEAEVFKGEDTGTRIIISKLRDPLTRSDVRYLYRNIESIKSPFEHKKFKFESSIPSFEVSLSVEGKPKWTEGLNSIDNIISQSLFRFSFVIEKKKWSWVYEFTPNEQLKKELRIEPTTLTANDENFEFSNNTLKNEYKNDDLSDLGVIYGEVYVFDFDADVNSFYQETGAVKTFLTENKGMRVYRDGIRVYNYGEPSDDWLEMDNRRVNKLGSGLNRGITVGAIALSLEETENLTEKTNREGFVENSTYLKLKNVVSSALGKLESFRNIDKTRLREFTKKEAKSSITQIENPIEDLRQAVNKRGLDDELGPKITRVEKSYNEMRDIMLTSGMAGLNMSVAFHEIHRGIKDTKKAIAADMDKEKILFQFDRFEILLDTYANMLKKEKVKDYEIKRLLQGNMDLASVRLRAHGIIKSCPVLVGDQDNYIVKIPPHLLTSAINNLIDNSIYWLDQRWGDDENKKYLYVGVSDEFEKGPAIIIADNGAGWRGISPHEVVKPFMTTKPGGMGIGLYYTNTVMEMIGGELLILESNDVDVPKAADGAIAALIFNGGEKCKT